LRNVIALASAALAGAVILSGIAYVMLQPQAEPPAPTTDYPRPPAAERFTGRLALLIDGDSIIIAEAPDACGTDPRGAARTGALGCRSIRLQGIDAPELRQTCSRDGRAETCGITARAALEHLIGSAELACETPADDPRDRYGRYLAFCRTAAGVDINLEMVRQGQAVAFRRYLRQRPHAPTYIAAEAEAYRARRGIWATEFTLPGDYRAARRAGQ
jgi:endonuclease YncB( thermonuclease family)